MKECPRLLIAASGFRYSKKLPKLWASESQPIRLCLIGSVACVFGGMAARTSRDLDVWKPASDYDLVELRRAVEAAGLSFDPKSTLDPEKPYIQLVEPGPTQVGVFKCVPWRKHSQIRVEDRPLKIWCTYGLLT